jgi:hypothetical protein
MKIVFTIVLLCSFLPSNAQDIAPELRQKLTGKTKFEDVKTTINNHYEAKLNTLEPRDSVARKAIMRQMKKWNRQFWLSEYYTNADGLVQDKNKIDDEAFTKLNNNNNSNVYARQAINWINQGPFNADKGIGRVDKIAFHPTNPNVIYAGTPHSGLYKTFDGGDTWFNTSPNLPSLGISGIAIDPSNPQIIYVLTGDANSGESSLVNTYLYRSNSAGVFKSYDGGSNWERSGFLASSFVDYRGADLIINPFNPNILIAATSNGIYRTTNGGVVWDYVSSAKVFDLEFKPNNPSIVYATNNTFLKSTDGGITFSSINIPALAGADRISIGVTAANSNKVFLFAGPGINVNSFRGLFISTQSGDANTFSLATNTPNLFYDFTGSAAQQLLTNTTNGQSNYNNCIAVSPTNENEIYVGGLCVWKSTNGGIGWTQISAYWPSGNPYTHPDIHELKFNPLNSALFCGNDGGVYKYNGAGWDIKYVGIAASQFYHFERENDEGDIWGGSQDNGILEQAAGGNYFLYNGGDGYDVMTDHEYLVANGDDDDVYMTVNASIKKDFAGTITDINVPGNIQFFGNLAMSPVEEDKIYVGYQNGVYRSTDAGSNWNNIGASGNWCISTCRTNDNRVYAAGTGIAGQRLFRMDLATFAITNITPPAPYDNALKITDIEVNPTSANDIWISVGGTEANAKVFASGNGGNSWTNLTFNLPNVPIFCIKKDANNYGLYVGTSIGVFYKKSGNNFWEPYSNGLPPVPVTEIELWPEPNPVGGNVPSNAPTIPEIWISTFGRGIWYTQQYSNTCDVNLTLNGGVVGQLVKEATGVINSSQNLQGGVGTSVKYNAGNYILLTDGFFAPLNSSFQTFNSGCGGQIDLNRAAPARASSAPAETIPKKR